MKLENDCLLIEINSVGAELTRIYSKKTELEYLWEGDSKFWGRQSPILFPTVGLLKDKKYTIDGVKYTLPQHGFARDCDFEIINQKNNSVILELIYSEETLKIYPFKFSLEISYHLDKNKLNVGYKVINIDTKEILFSIGGHPGFKCPLVEGTLFEDYYFEFTQDENPKQLFINPVIGLLNGKEANVDLGKRIPLDYSLFKNDALIYEGLKSTEVSLVSSKHQHGLTFNFEDWKYLAFWTKGKDAPFICIEPWCGIADSENGNTDFSTKLGIEKLAVEKTFAIDYSMEFF